MNVWDIVLLWGCVFQMDRLGIWYIVRSAIFAVNFDIWEYIKRLSPLTLAMFSNINFIVFYISFLINKS